MKLKQHLLTLGSAFKEAVTCLLLALRTSLHPGVALRSCFLCLTMFALTTWLFIAQYEAILLISGGTALFITLGAMALGLLPVASTGGGLIAVSTAFLTTLVTLGMFVAGLTPVVAVALYFILAVFSIRILLPWLMMGPIRQRVLRHYPSLTERSTSAGTFSDSLRYMLTPWLGLGMASLLLLIPFLNGIVLLALLAYLNVRFLTPSAFKGVANDSEQVQAIRQQRGATVFFGLMIFWIACIPVLNLLLPALLGAGTCHLSYRGLSRKLAATGMEPEGQVSLPSP